MTKCVVCPQAQLVVLAVQIFWSENMEGALIAAEKAGGDNQAVVRDCLVIT